MQHRSTGTTSQLLIMCYHTATPGKKELRKMIKVKLASHRTTEVTKIRGTDTNVANIQDGIQ